jgi:3-hydroxyisobutyrate dehydrogenase-like beta-hydroxyacid dehydrogenase
MLADDQAVEEIVFAKQGLLSTLPPGTTHISMSTIGVALSDRLAQAHRGAEQDYVAAPVFGRPEAAAAAKLFIVAAGAEDAIGRCQPIFAALGQRTFTLPGAPSAANLVKLSGNFLIAAVIEGLAEAIALVRKGGIDPRAYLEILTGTLFTAPVYKTYGDLIVGEKYDQVGFGAALGLKDIRLALAAAEASRAPLPLASLVRDHLLALLAQGGDAQDWSALGRLAARNAGL